MYTEAKAGQIFIKQAITKIIEVAIAFDYQFELVLLIYTIL